MRRSRFIIAATFLSLALLTVAGDALATNNGGAAGGTGSAPPASTGSLMGRLRRVGGAAGVDAITSETTFAEIIGKIIYGATSLLGVIFVAQMVYAGWLWMTAAGEEDQITKAKNIIRRSIVGLAIVLAAWAITFAVLQRLYAATG